ncbi:glycosyltransferase family 4 protein [Candidatus Woesearchaeota archaeon]|nr:glycosyltransferase family 4 protein [Candidatus Woesearchaeota archaeon]
MKIAILTPTFNYYSGIDRVAQDRAERLSKKGHKVTVFAFEAKIKPKGYKTIRIYISQFLERFYRLFPFLYFNKNIIKKLKEFDQIISFNEPMDSIAVQAKKRYKIEYIAWFSGFYARGENLLEKIYMTIFRYFYLKDLKQADKIVCVSNTIKNKLINSDIDIKKTKVEYDLNNIDKSRFNRNVKKMNLSKINEIIRNYNLQNKRVFLYVGRLATSKRVDLLIKMFKMEKNEHPEYKLIIVGKPTFKRYFKKLLSMADEDVIFTGEVYDKDLPAYYAVSDVFVTASQDEGFNLPAVEAQACGKPVVAFDVGSNRELIKKGTLVREGDINGFTSAMNSYANSVR